MEKAAKNKKKRVSKAIEGKLRRYIEKTYGEIVWVKK